MFNKWKNKCGYILLLMTAVTMLTSCVTKTWCVTPDGRVFSCSANGKVASTWEFPDGTKASIDTKSDSLLGQIVSCVRPDRTDYRIRSDADED
jgi:hypothetical protein